MEVTKTNFLFRVVISLKKEKSFARIKISIKEKETKGETKNVMIGWIPLISNSLSAPRTNTHN